MSFMPTPVPMPLRIGKYRITGLIGEGAMGVVYRAQDPDIQRSVAIKTIRAPLRDSTGDGPTALRQFRVEAQAAGRLNHPNIVAIYESGEYGDLGEELFIAMECIDGPSLAALAKQGERLALPDVIAVMLQLLEALQCAHAQRVWHCDIKPSNLLVAADGRIKVTDFGIARVEASGITLRNALWGSPGYMAPERFAGGAMDQRVDLFSCGVLLYELLAGSAPFVGSASSVMYQVLQQQPPAPSTLPGSVATPALDAVVARAIAKRPGDRFASAEDMRRALLVAAPSARTPRTLSREALAAVQRHGTGPQAALTSWPVVAGPPTLIDAVTQQYVPQRDGPAELPPTVQAAITPPAPAAPAVAEAPVSRTAPPLPAAAATDTSRFDSAALSELEALLRPCLGAVSRFVIREAARRSQTLAELVTRVAEDALTPAERPVFLRRARRLPAVAAALGFASEAAAADTGGGIPSRPPEGAEPLLVARTPLTPEMVEKAGRLLAKQGGPIALVLARRAAAGCSSREVFFHKLADAACEMMERKALLAALYKLD